MKHTLKKGLALLITIAMLLSFLPHARPDGGYRRTPPPAPVETAGKYTDGTYTASAYAA